MLLAQILAYAGMTKVTVLGLKVTWCKSLVLKTRVIKISYCRFTLLSVPASPKLACKRLDWAVSAAVTLPKSA